MKLGPSLHDALVVLAPGTGARVAAKVKRTIVAAQETTPRGRCSYKKEPSIGYGGVIARCAGKDRLEVLQENDWGKKEYVPRKWCTMRGCFDFSRPACQVEGLLPVYWYNKHKKDNPCLLHQCNWVRGYSYPNTMYNHMIKLVKTAEEACVFVLSPGSVGVDDNKAEVGEEFNYAQDLKHWSAAGAPGRNHILISTQCLVHCDHLGNHRRFGSIGDAIVAHQSMWKGTYRPGFDIAMPQPITSMINRTAKQTGNRQPFKTSVSLARPLLVGFRGTVLSDSSRWFHHRVIASEWSHNVDKGVIIDVKDKNSKRKGSSCQHYETNHQWEFDEMLGNSSYCFAPGGGGPYSFRLFECMSRGAIPVVTDDLILPWEDTSGITWDTCVIRVTESELKSLSDVLLAIAPPGSSEFVARVAACGLLWDSLGLKNSEKPEKWIHTKFWSEMKLRIWGAFSAV